MLKYKRLKIYRIMKYIYIYIYILHVKVLKTFLGKSDFCGMTEMSGAFDKTEIDGNTIILTIGEENGKKVYVYWWRYDLLFSN